MDQARLSMEIEADLLAAGASIQSAPPWLRDITRRISWARTGCEHLAADDAAVFPLYYYPDTPGAPSVMCAKCATPPPAICHLCHGPATEGIVAASGVLLVTVALCETHMAEMRDETD